MPSVKKTGIFILIEINYKWFDLDYIMKIITLIILSRNFSLSST